MKKEDFNGVDLRKKMEEEPDKAHLWAQYINDIDYSDLNLGGLSDDDIHQLGMDYQNGENGKEQDSYMAKKYYTAAADRGYVNSQYNLADLYHNDYYPNYTKAMYWMKKVAESGDVEAKFHVGAMYHDGEGVERDFLEAIKWYEAAAEGGFSPAWCCIGMIYNNTRDDGAPADFAKAIEYFQKGTEAGDPNAYYYLGVAYTMGIYLKQDDTAAFACFEKAAAANIPYALKEIDALYTNGKVKHGLYKTAAEWYSGILDNGTLARNYAYILSVSDENDPALLEKSAFWYEQAALKKDIKAFYQLVFIYNHYKAHSITDKEPTTEKMVSWANMFFPRDAKNAKAAGDGKKACELLIQTITEIARYAAAKGIVSLPDKIKDSMHDVLKTGLNLVAFGLNHAIVVSILQLLSEPGKRSEQIIIKGVDCIQKGMAPEDVQNTLMALLDQKSP